MAEEDDHFWSVCLNTVNMDPQMYTHGHILISIPYSKQNELGMAVHACYCSTQEVKAEWSGV